MKEIRICLEDKDIQVLEQAKEILQMTWKEMLVELGTAASEGGIWVFGNVDVEKEMKKNE